MKVIERPIPEQQDQVKASKDRVKRAIKFFEEHFDKDGNPITQRGLIMSYRYYDPVYFPVNKIRVFSTSHRQ